MLKVGTKYQKVTKQTNKTEKEQEAWKLLALAHLIVKEARICKDEPDWDSMFLRKIENNTKSKLQCCKFLFEMPETMTT